MRARCPWCGDIRITIDGLRCASSQDHVAALCEFECPSCGKQVYQRTSAERAADYVARGARPGARVPLELLEEHAGPPICWDDILDFRIAIEQLEQGWSEGRPTVRPTGR